MAKETSIGDDPEFRILTRIWRDNAPHATGAKAWHDLVAYVDSRASEGQAQTSAAEELIDCPACIGSWLKGQKRGVRCVTCKGHGYLSINTTQLASSSGCGCSQGQCCQKCDPYTSKLNDSTGSKP